MTKKPIKALALLSGGLDSLLAAFLVQQQGIQVTGLAFESLFFRPKVLAHRGFNPPIKVIDISLAHLKMVKNAAHGYGKNANPCLDCHLLMLKMAKKIMCAQDPSASGRQNYDFIITGEVLGQRPFSQNPNALKTIEKEADLKDFILRPLSGQLFPATIPEQKGWIKRNKLLNISGRSRKIQLELAKKFKITGFATPGASCILTDPQFSKRLLQMLKINPQANNHDIALLGLGRHFWQGKNLFVVGRNHEENLALKKLVLDQAGSGKKITQKNDFIIEPQSFPGPLILGRSWGKMDQNQVLKEAKKLLLKYSPKAPKELFSKDFSLKTVGPRPTSLRLVN